MACFPQETIDSIIGTFHPYDDKATLKKCALVSRSFLIPSRRKLFSSLGLRSEERCQNLYPLLVQNPYIQSSITSLSIYGGYGGYPIVRNGLLASKVMLSILRLPFRSLRKISVVFFDCYFGWDELGSDIRDTFRDLIHSSPLVSITLCGGLNVPVDLFLGLRHIQEINLDRVSLDIFRNKHSPRTADPVEEISSTSNNRPIERFRWSFRGMVGVPRIPSRVARIPFISHPRAVDIDLGNLLLLSDFDFVLLTLDASLQPPATLEHLTLECNLRVSRDADSFQRDLRARGAWTRLDGIIALPTYSLLRRVDVKLVLLVQDIEIYAESDTEPRAATQIRKLLPQKLPSLTTKGIAFVTVLTIEG